MLANIEKKRIDIKTKQDISVSLTKILPIAKEGLNSLLAENEFEVFVEAFEKSKKSGLDYLATMMQVLFGYCIKYTRNDEKFLKILSDVIEEFMNSAPSKAEASRMFVVDAEVGGILANVAKGLVGMFVAEKTENFSKKMMILEIIGKISVFDSRIVLSYLGFVWGELFSENFFNFGQETSKKQQEKLFDEKFSKFFHNLTQSTIRGRMFSEFLQSFFTGFEKLKSKVSKTKEDSKSSKISTKVLKTSKISKDFDKLLTSIAEAAVPTVLGDVFGLLKKQILEFKEDSDANFFAAIFFVPKRLLMKTALTENNFEKIHEICGKFLKEMIPLLTNLSLLRMKTEKSKKAEPMIFELLDFHFILENFNQKCESFIPFTYYEKKFKVTSKKQFQDQEFSNSDLFLIEIDGKQLISFENLNQIWEIASERAKIVILLIIHAKLYSLHSKINCFNILQQKMMYEIKEEDIPAKKAANKAQISCCEKEFLAVTSWVLDTFEKTVKGLKMTDIFVENEEDEENVVIFELLDSNSSNSINSIEKFARFFNFLLFSSFLPLFFSNLENFGEEVEQTQQLKCVSSFVAQFCRLLCHLSTTQASEPSMLFKTIQSVLKMKNMRNHFIYYFKKELASLIFKENEDEDTEITQDVVISKLKELKKGKDLLSADEDIEKFKLLLASINQILTPVVFGGWLGPELSGLDDLFLLLFIFDVHFTNKLKKSVKKDKKSSKDENLEEIFYFRSLIRSKMEFLVLSFSAPKTSNNLNKIFSFPRTNSEAIEEKQTKKQKYSLSKKILNFYLFKQEENEAQAPASDMRELFLWLFFDLLTLSSKLKRVLFPRDGTQEEKHKDDAENLKERKQLATEEKNYKKNWEIFEKIFKKAIKASKDTFIFDSYFSYSIRRLANPNDPRVNANSSIFIAKLKEITKDSDLIDKRIEKCFLNTLEGCYSAQSSQNLQKLINILVYLSIIGINNSYKLSTVFIDYVDLIFQAFGSVFLKKTQELSAIDADLSLILRISFFLIEKFNHHNNEILINETDNQELVARTKYNNFMKFLTKHTVKAVLQLKLSENEKNAFINNWVIKCRNNFNHAHSLIVLRDIADLMKETLGNAEILIKSGKNKEKVEEDLKMCETMFQFAAGTGKMGQSNFDQIYRKYVSVEFEDLNRELKVLQLYLK